MENRKRLESLTVDKLRSRAKAAGHSGLSRLKKAELVDLLMADKQAQVEQEATPPEQVEQITGPSNEIVKAKTVSLTLARLLQTAGIVGVALSLILSVALPAGSLWLAGRLAKQMDQAAQAISGAGESLGIAARSLESGADALDSGSQALRTANQSLQGMDPLLNSVGTLLSDEIPQSIEATQDALVSAQDGAAAMDRVLRGLRLLGLDYDPDLPLDQSLAQTAGSLEGLPEALRQTEQDLSQSQDDLAQMGDDLTVLAGNFDTFSNDLDDIVEEIQEINENLESTSVVMESWSDRLPSLRWVFAGVSFLLGLWFVLLHFNLWVVGRMAAGLHANK